MPRSGTAVWGINVTMNNLTRESMKTNVITNTRTPRSSLLLGTLLIFLLASALRKFAAYSRLEQTFLRLRLLLLPHRTNHVTYRWILVNVRCFVSSIGCITKIDDEIVFSIRALRIESKSLSFAKPVFESKFELNFSGKPSLMYRYLGCYEHVLSRYAHQRRRCVWGWDLGRKNVFFAAAGRAKRKKKGSLSVFPHWFLSLSNP